MGETRVNLGHMLENIRDAYPRAVEETIISEMIANALDAGARHIRLLTDMGAPTLTVIDDGRGMSRASLRRFHDLATTTKSRGESIGFAGVGIKLGLLVSDQVRTETRKNGNLIATQWRLAATHRAPWSWTEPQGFVQDHGTAVTLHLSDPLGPLVDASFVEACLCREFSTLLNPLFDELLSRWYPEGIQFTLNGGAIPRGGESAGQALKRLRLKGQRGYSGLVILTRSETPLPEEDRGIAISTRGKVITRGWDWLGITPTDPECIKGVVEVPALAQSLTLNKADFLRTGAPGAAYVAYRSAIQEAVSDQLQEWGMARDRKTGSRPSVTRPSEKEFERILAQITENFPLLTPLVERLKGGQHRLPMAARSGGDLLPGAVSDRQNEQAPSGEKETAAPAETSERPSVTEPRGGSRSRRSRYRLRIEFERRPESDDISRLERSTIWVNQSHPAYIRATATRSTGYHLAVAAATALAPVAAGPEGYDRFLASFLMEWGKQTTDRGR